MNQYFITYITNNSTIPCYCTIFGKSKNEAILKFRKSTKYFDLLLKIKKIEKLEDSIYASIN